ncbi:hypothetical protein CHGG_07967 [Chaetomium globosum CBS 148.51]|uniref:Glucoamylase n=1 Tax=Chaetomium globosum (strain ATCC 6205 / CBS 148.51 / DSM 1962 / NBRC 6347 / NRRL 1970) TaxID=306901 RepID=Q2GVN7_CHAGB|nr:uncharacterized protein CHGG_07967 [Chaetomium globosum CBS 148.51]EAQ86714.1 hypothetical protein CHGG_07967 [Chaetomium globosum CBS 148.51]
MHALSSLFVLGTCAVQTVLGRPEAALRAKREGAILKRSVDSFIETQTPIAWNKLLCNIGPNGCAASGAAPGAVIASPSKSEPDYWYTWTRDAALVMTGLVDSFAHNYSASLQTTIQNFIVSTAKLQGVSNPSGGLSDGAGLGEPKFMVDLKQFTGEWGRPQRDGPPLRAIALTRYAKWLITNGYKDTAKDVVWPVIKNDLAYTAQYWNETGFDLWEEVPGSSFFTIGSSHRVSPPTPPQPPPRPPPTNSPKSTAASIRSGQGRQLDSDLDPQLRPLGLGCDSNTFQPCSEKALSNHKVYVDSFRTEYGINSGIPQGKAVAVGRYTEDVYYKGNPWYLANFAAAEQIYDAIYVWKKDGSITVTQLSLPFFKDLVPSITTGTYTTSSPTHAAIITAASTYADGFIDIAAKYAGSGGSLAEQYDRNTGAPLSAADLTWSYAAFLSAADRRAGIVPVTGWSAEDRQHPAFLTPNAAAEPAPVPFPEQCADAANVFVTFSGRVTTEWGQSVKVVGNVPALGAWDLKKAVKMSASGYTATNPLWSITVPMAAGTAVQFKFVRWVRMVRCSGSRIRIGGLRSRRRLRPLSGCSAQKVEGSWRVRTPSFISDKA